MPIDKVGVNLLYLPKKRLAFEFIRFREQFSFAEDKMDMIVCLVFVMVEG